MIGRLRGGIVETSANVVLIEAGGVGYEIELTSRARAALGAPGSECTLYTHQVVREDTQSLFGFPSREERDLFRILIRVSGVGPKVALAVLSAMSVAELVHAVGNDDVQALTRISGVGKKTAARLLVEIRDRLAGFLPTPTHLPGAQPATQAQDARREAVSALIGLGYRPQEASRAVDLVQRDDLQTADVIRLALRSMVPSEA